MKRIIYFLPSILLLFLFFFKPILETQERLVVKVLDGDTLELESGDSVRLIGIDAPEVDEPYHEEAREALMKMVEGKKVRLEKEEGMNKDKYGRFLRYVFVDGLFVNLEIVKLGLAKFKAEEDCKYYSDLKEAEKEAMGMKLGIWSSSEQLLP